MESCGLREISIARDAHKMKLVTESNLYLVSIFQWQLVKRLQLYHYMVLQVGVVVALQRKGWDIVALDLLIEGEPEEGLGEGEGEGWYHLTLQ